MRALLPSSVVLAALLMSAHAAAQPADAPPKADAPPAPAAAPANANERRDRARALFETGLAHFDRGEWSAALADFLRSRELFPTRTAALDAAVCLRKEGRFDEALDLLEDVLRTYADLDPRERGFAEKEMSELRPLVGAIDPVDSEPGATLVIDGRARGAFPPSTPLRVPAGARLVRIYKEGFVPFERRVDVAGRQVLTLDARLVPLIAGGRLVVTEANGGTLDVLIDDVVVGKTPWEATLTLGRHTVSLRGAGDLGTPPAEAIVSRDDVTRLSLSAEPLDSSVRVIPTPAGALVSIDGVVVGHGVWEGRLRSGPHRVELAADGFLPTTRDALLVKGERSSVAVSLERDVSSGAFKALNPGRFFVEANLGPGFGLVFGGDVRASCTDSCSAQVPLAIGTTLRGGYQFSSRIMIGLDAGYLAISAGTSSRPTDLTPRGLAPSHGTTDDSLYLRGIRVGPSVGYRFGEHFPLVTVRLGAGAFLGSAGDNRTGTFTTQTGSRYDVDLSESSRAVYLYAVPEARIGGYLAPRLEASIGLELMFLAALDRPAWTDAQPVVAGPPNQRGDGLATFGTQTLAGAFLVMAAPTVGLHYAF
jgi:hypothetical protein